MLLPPLCWHQRPHLFCRMGLRGHFRKSLRVTSPRCNCCSCPKKNLYPPIAKRQLSWRPLIVVFVSIPFPTAQALRVQLTGKRSWPIWRRTVYLPWNTGMTMMKINQDGHPNPASIICQINPLAWTYHGGVQGDAQCRNRDSGTECPSCK